MNLSSLIDEISDIIQDSAYDGSITGLINEASKAIATGMMIPGRFEKTPPLPELYTTGTVTTETTGIVSLPDDFNRDVVMVVTAAGDKVTIMPSHIKLRQDYHEVVAGDVFKCAVIGNRLMYRDVPSVAEALTVHYYKNPSTLTASGDTPVTEPTWIPEYLHRKLIVGYVCREIFNRIEDGIETKKINTAHYAAELNEGLIALEYAIGPDKEPDFYDSHVDYCP